MAQNTRIVSVPTPEDCVVDTTAVRNNADDDIQEALAYVLRVKARFADEPERYQAFLKILSTLNDSVLGEGLVRSFLVLPFEVE